MAKGDHIRVDRGAYFHHGIDVGDGTVIHFTGEPGQKSGAAIKRTSMNEFLSGGKAEIIKYSKSSAPSTVVAVALRHVGETGYNLITNNCEHFSRYCKTGQKKSEQVKDIVVSGSAVGGGAVATQAAITGVSAAGAVAGLSGPGVMAGLAAIGPGGAIGGVVTLAAAPAIVANLTVNKVLEDDKNLHKSELNARTAGRHAAKAGTLLAAGGTVATISTVGSAGLGAAGITTGLATIGGTVGGGMVAGTAIAVAAPATAAALTGYGIYKVWKWLSS